MDNDVKALTLGDFRRLTEGLPDDLQLTIPHEQMTVTMGSAPMANVVGVHSGFDWEAGTLQMQAEYPLAIGGDQHRAEAKESRRRGECLWFIGDALKDTRLTTEQKIERVRLILDRRGAGLKAEPDHG